MTTTIPKPLTADDLLKMGDIGRCELIYGELVMMSPAGYEHSVIANRIGRFLTEFVEDNDLGAVLAAEAGYKIESKPDLVRAPDASFIRKDRLPKTALKKYFPGVPDLAVEVISPGDTRREIAEKVNMWLAHGTTSCWVLDPDSRTVTIHRAGHKAMRLTARDRIENEPILPGFVLDIARIYKRP
jgi:Uma2 family endonuclease